MAIQFWTISVGTQKLAQRKRATNCIPRQEKRGQQMCPKSNLHKSEHILKGGAQMCQAEARAKFVSPALKFVSPVLKFAAFAWHIYATPPHRYAHISEYLPVLCRSCS